MEHQRARFLMFKLNYVIDRYYLHLTPRKRTAETTSVLASSSPWAIAGIAMGPKMPTE